MYNIKQLTNNDLQDFETVTIDGTQYAVVPASFLGDGIIKLGFCLAKRSDFGTSFFITVNGKQCKIRVGKTGIYELNMDYYFDKNNKKRALNPIVTELKLPKRKTFVLDYVTYINTGKEEEEPMEDVKGKNILYWTSSADNSFDINDIVIYNSNLYTCIEPNSDLTFEEEKWSKIGGEVEHYELPTASEDTLGGVKVGENLNIDENGVLSAEKTPEYSLPIAGNDTLGGVKIGEGINMDENGVISVDNSGSGSGSSSSGSESNVAITPFSEDQINQVLQIYNI